MKYTVELTFYNVKDTCLGWSFQDFANMLNGLIYEMKDNKIGHQFTGDQYHNLRFIMSIPLYYEFSIACKTFGHGSNIYKDIPIYLDLSSYMDDTQSPDGMVRLIYEEPKVFYDEFIGLDRGHGFQRVPHIDHVKFNGPATIIFWKDGTKTVVKHDGKGRKDKRQAILYAFIRKIYGEGKPYHNILNEIERTIK